MNMIRRNSLKLKSYCTNHRELHLLIIELSELEKKVNDIMKSYDSVLSQQEVWAKLYSPNYTSLDSVCHDLQKSTKILHPGWQQLLLFIATHRRSLQELLTREYELDEIIEKLNNKRKKCERLSLNVHPRGNSLGQMEASPEKHLNGLKAIIQRRHSKEMERTRNSLSSKQCKLAQLEAKVEEDRRKLHQERISAFRYGMSAFADAFLYFSQLLALTSKTQQQILNSLTDVPQFDEISIGLQPDSMKDFTMKAENRPQDCKCCCHEISCAPALSLMEQNVVPTAPPAYSEVVSNASPSTLYPFDALKQLNLSGKVRTTRRSLPANFNNSHNDKKQHRSTSVHQRRSKK